MGVIVKFINKYEKMTKEFSLGALTKTSYKLNHFLLLFSVAQEIRKKHDDNNFNAIKYSEYYCQKELFTLY